MNEPLLQRLADNVYRARQRKGISQAELGRVAGVDSTQISRIEAGKREPRLTMIVLLARALDLTETELIHGDR